MLLYRTKQGALVASGTSNFLLPELEWNRLFHHTEPLRLIEGMLAKAQPYEQALEDITPLAPVVSQEVWAAGVTYYRSRDARMEEASQSGGSDFYSRVYAADRPELFMKATPHRCVGQNEGVRVRRDSAWNVPEPELTLVVNTYGDIFGYTIGNDMSSRDIEGENPLYLPQAKVYNQCCALGPAIYLSTSPLPSSTEINILIEREGKVVFTGTTSLAQMRRTPDELVSWLFRDNSFPDGCLLLTGTGIVPTSEFSLTSGDIVSITIEPIGTLRNPVI